MRPDSSSLGKLSTFCSSHGVIAVLARQEITGRAFQCFCLVSTVSGQPTGRVVRTIICSMSVWLRIARSAMFE